MFDIFGLGRPQEGQGKSPSTQGRKQLASKTATKKKLASKTTCKQAHTTSERRTKTKRKRQAKLWQHTREEKLPTKSYVRYL